MMCSFARCGEKNGRPIVCCTRDGCDNRMWGSDPSACFAECWGGAGWGDRLARGLRRFGITPRFVIRLKMRLGLLPVCRCYQRRQWLNAIGEWVARRVGWLRGR